MRAEIGPVEWEVLLRRMGVKPLTALDWRDAFAAEVQPAKFSAGMADLVAFIPQVLHECVMLERLEECLSYSAERLCKVWPSRFPSTDISCFYAGEPEKLANLVYGDRMGNVHPGDGWKYRGRGPIMLTGRDGYRHVGGLMGRDLEADPAAMCDRAIGLCASVHWWEDRVPDSFLSDQVRLRRRVNGGTTGLEQVAGLYALAREVFA